MAAVLLAEYSSLEVGEEEEAEECKVLVQEYRGSADWKEDIEERKDLTHKLLMALAVYLVAAPLLSVRRAVVNPVKALLLSVRRAMVFQVEYYRDRPLRSGQVRAFQHWKRMLG